MQLRAVHKVDTRIQDHLLLLLEGLEVGRRHGRFNAHMADIALCCSDGLDDLIRAAAGSQIEAQLVKSRFAKRLQVFLCAKGAVGIHMLMNAGLRKTADDAIIGLDLHKGLQIDITDPAGLRRDPQQKLHVLFIVPCAADLPQSLADGRLTIQHAVIIAEGALEIAAVRFADR